MTPFERARLIRKSTGPSVLCVVWDISYVRSLLAYQEGPELGPYHISGSAPHGSATISLPGASCPI